MEAQQDALPGLRRLGLWGVLALAICVATPSGYAVAGDSPAAPLIFAGSGTNLEITRLLAKAFERVRPDIRIEIPGSLGSAGGISAVREGVIAVGLVARPLNGAEREMGLTVLPYARTAIVFAAHQTVGDENVTTDDVVQIYAGVKTQWKDGHPIAVLSRQVGDSSLEVLEREIPRFKDAYRASAQANRWAVFYTDQDMSQALGRTPYSIGMAALGVVKSEKLPVRALKFNGASPSPENIRNGLYPLVNGLSFVYRKDALPAGAAMFLTFVGSKEGERVLRANGFLPGE
jgi:phosphate transport system substrate-binding protein